MVKRVMFSRATAKISVNNIGNGDVIAFIDYHSVRWLVKETLRNPLCQYK